MGVSDSIYFGIDRLVCGRSMRDHSALGFETVGNDGSFGFDHFGGFHGSMRDDSPFGFHHGFLLSIMEDASEEAIFHVFALDDSIREDQADDERSCDHSKNEDERGMK